MTKVAFHIGPLAEHFAEPLRVAARAASEEEPGLDVVRETVVAWRAWISEGLERNGLLARPLHWDEDASPDEPAELEVDALRALKLFLAHGGSASCPPRLPEQPELDPAWIAMAQADFADSPYDQILVPEFWLPAAFDFTFACPLPDGHELQTGSIDALLTQCATLRERLFAATPLDAAMWAKAEVESRGTRALARHALGVLEQTAGRAARAHLPMLMHAGR